MLLCNYVSLPPVLKSKKVVGTTWCRRKGPRGEKIGLTSNLLEIILLFSFSCFVGAKSLTFTNPLALWVPTLICSSGFCITILQIMKVVQRWCVLPNHLSTCNIKVSVTVCWFLSISISLYTYCSSKQHFLVILC